MADTAFGLRVESPGALGAPPAAVVQFTLTVGSPGPGGPPGATGPAGPPGSGTAPNFTGENKSGATLAAGQVVAIHASGVGVDLASQTAAGYPAVGLAAAAVTAAVSGSYQTDGPLALADWSGSLDTAAATLTPKSLYFVSATSGKLTATPPTATGRYSQAVGYAVTATTLEIEIGQPLLL